MHHKLSRKLPHLFQKLEQIRNSHIRTRLPLCTATLAIYQAVVRALCDFKSPTQFSWSVTLLATFALLHTTWLGSFALVSKRTLSPTIHTILACNFVCLCLVHDSYCDYQCKSIHVYFPIFSPLPASSLLRTHS